MPGNMRKRYKGKNPVTYRVTQRGEQWELLSHRKGTLRIIGTYQTEKEARHALWYAEHYGTTQGKVVKGGATE